MLLDLRIVLEQLLQILLGDPDSVVFNDDLQLHVLLHLLDVLLDQLDFAVDLPSAGDSLEVSMLPCFIYLFFEQIQVDLQEAILLCELQAVAEEVDEDLVEPSRVTEELPEDVWPIHIKGQEELDALEF